jgi:hypothetical protein
MKAAAATLASLLVVLLSVSICRSQPVYWASSIPTFYSFAVTLSDNSVQVLLLRF